MDTKDPYLSELDDLGDETYEAVEDTTRADANDPPAEEDLGFEDLPDPEAQVAEKPIAGDFMDLAPDIPVQLSVVMGRKQLTVKDLLEFQSGQVLDLERQPNEPVDLMAGGKVVGKGDLVVVDGKLGIRILQFIK